MANNLPSIALLWAASKRFAAFDEHCNFAVASAIPPDGLDAFVRTGGQPCQRQLLCDSSLAHLLVPSRVQLLASSLSSLPQFRLVHGRNSADQFHL